MQHINPLEIRHGDFMIMIDIKILQEVLHIKVINLIGHVEILEDQLDNVLDLLPGQVPVLPLVENVEEHSHGDDYLLELGGWLWHGEF